MEEAAYTRENGLDKATSSLKEALNKEAFEHVLGRALVHAVGESLKNRNIRIERDNSNYGGDEKFRIIIGDSAFNVSIDNNLGYNIKRFLGEAVHQNDNSYQTNSTLSNIYTALGNMESTLQRINETIKAQNK